MLAIANRGASEKAAGQNALLRRDRGCAPQSAARRPGRRPRSSSANSTRSAFSSPAIRSRPTITALKRLRDPLGRFRPLGAGRGDDRSAWRERARPLRAPHQDRLQDRDRAAFRPVRPVRGDPVPGGADQFRDLLEKGSDVLVTLQASLEGEDVRARIVTSNGSTTPPPRFTRA